MPLFYLIAMVEKVSGEVTIRVETAEEHHNAVRDAESFGMQLEETEVRGQWRRDSDYETLELSEESAVLLRVEGGYFYIKVGQEVFALQPTGHFREGATGQVELTFR